MFVALSLGIINILEELAAPFRAEIGIMSEAGSTVSWLVKKVTVRVVL